MELYCLQTSDTAHLFALYSSFYYLQHHFFKNNRSQMSTLCFWCQVENTMDCFLIFNIPTIIPEILTFLWWRTLRHFGSEASYGVCTHTSALLPVTWGFRGDKGEAPALLPGRAVVFCSWLLVLDTASAPCCSLTSGWGLWYLVCQTTYTVIDCSKTLSEAGCEILLPQASWNSVSVCQCWNCHLENSACLWVNLTKPLFSWSLAIERW